MYFQFTAIPILSTQELLSKYELNHEDKNIIAEMNIHLFHSNYYENTTDCNKIFIMFYDMEKIKHNQNESEIF